MSIINSQPLIGASGQSGGYTIAKSLRFRSSASAFLSRTPGVAGNRKTWTFSAWVKRGSLSGVKRLFDSNDPGATDSTRFISYFDSNGIFYIDGANNNFRTTSAVFRDPSAWYHIVINVDTTSATAANRLLVYVNNISQSFSSSLTITQNSDLGVNQTTSHNIGGISGNSFDGYIAEANFIDGQQLTPSSFGETDSITGVWKPKAYSGTYGTNGFYLKFTDVATTSGSNAGLGKDFSGNGNYWTTNNISVTSGATYDSMTDVPTLTDADTANFCTLNPVASNIALTNGNLVLPDGGSGFESRCAGTIGFSSGKFYFEDLVGGTYFNNQMGVYLADKAIANATLRYVFLQNGNKYDGTTQTSYGSTYASGDIIGVAVDLDSGKIWFSINGTFQASGNPVSGTNAAFTGLTGTHLPFFTGYNNGSGTSTNTVNFGQRPFAYTPPTGFKALNTYNLPDSAIVAGNKVMDATTFTATGTTQTVTNAGGFKPDLVWTKVRSVANDHLLNDSVRGVANYLIPNKTDAEASASTFLTSLNSNGFTLGTGNYTNGYTLVGWQWQAGQGSTSSNTSGSITSTVSVNASAGFSIVTFNNATSGNYTVGHGLGVAPKFILLKYKSISSNWFVYHASLGYTQNIFLNLTNAANAVTYYTADPSSTVINFSSSFADNPSQPLVAYCWSEIAGFSKFGSYTGNGSADGPFIYTGFRPKYVIIKRSSGVESWLVKDSSRAPFNTKNNANLFANNSNAEDTYEHTVDFLSNGFKIRTTDYTAVINASGDTYVYACFAENPYKNSLAR